jgi:hypothetical protein
MTDIANSHRLDPINAEQRSHRGAPCCGQNGHGEQPPHGPHQCRTAERVLLRVCVTGSRATPPRATEARSSSWSCYFPRMRGWTSRPGADFSLAGAPSPLGLGARLVRAVDVLRAVVLCRWLPGVSNRSGCWRRRSYVPSPGQDPLGRFPRRPPSRQPAPLSRTSLAKPSPPRVWDAGTPHQTAAPGDRRPPGPRRCSTHRCTYRRQNCRAANPSRRNQCSV